MVGITLISLGFEMDAENLSVKGRDGGGEKRGLRSVNFGWFRKLECPVRTTDDM